MLEASLESEENVRCQISNGSYHKINHKEGGNKQGRHENRITFTIDWQDSQSDRHITG